jgi:hypothetical protein
LLCVPTLPAASTTQLRRRSFRRTQGRHRSRQSKPGPSVSTETFSRCAAVQSVAGRQRRIEAAFDRRGQVVSPPAVGGGAGASQLSSTIAVIRGAPGATIDGQLELRRAARIVEGIDRGDGRSIVASAGKPSGSSPWTGRADAGTEPPGPGVGNGFGQPAVIEVGVDIDQTVLPASALPVTTGVAVVADFALVTCGRSGRRVERRRVRAQ